jgi:hypothetical protein
VIAPLSRRPVCLMLVYCTSIGHRMLTGHVGAITGCSQEGESSRGCLRLEERHTLHCNVNDESLNSNVSTRSFCIQNMKTSTPLRR